MTRTLVTLREAGPSDALFLADLWQDALRRTDREDQVADLELIIKTAAHSPEQRIVIAEYDGEPVGAVFLQAASLSPINLETVVQVLSPHVIDSARRKGAGRALMEAAVAFADELGVSHVAAAASMARDGNRFLARLGFGAHATLRVAPTQMVRAKLAAQLPASQRIVADRTHLGQILAARRSMRRQQQPAAGA